MSEEDWQALVVDVARLGGFLVAHFRPARTVAGWRTPIAADGRGFPDLVCVKPGRIVVAELKRAGRYPSAEQRLWLERFAEAGAEVYTWRPVDEPEVWRVLAGREPPVGGGDRGRPRR